MASIDTFPIYEVLVESIFGSFGLAVMGVALVLLIILLITKTSRVFLIYWMIFYFIVMGTLYIGALALMLGFMIAIVYFVYGIFKSFFREG
jgi:hypothetical protein|tara:strand:- start:4964 stop:5236 length:273 start_codon:yes stop_codon:yes gene_type:complete